MNQSVLMIGSLVVELEYNNQVKGTSYNAAQVGQAINVANDIVLHNYSGQKLSFDTWKNEVELLIPDLLLFLENTQKNVLIAKTQPVFKDAVTNARYGRLQQPPVSGEKSINSKGISSIGDALNDL